MSNSGAKLRLVCKNLSETVLRKCDISVAKNGNVASCKESAAPHRDADVNIFTRILLMRYGFRFRNGVGKTTP